MEGKNRFVIYEECRVAKIFDSWIQVGKVQKWDECENKVKYRNETKTKVMWGIVICKGSLCDLKRYMYEKDKTS